MQEWEKRYLHAKDMRDVQCKIRNIPIPEDEAYGQLKVIPGLWSELKGNEFTKLFESLGHDHGDFDYCCCKTR